MRRASSALKARAGDIRARLRGGVPSTGDVPVVINCRDRFESLVRLVSWLERAVTREIILLDNDSMYPPLLDFYSRTEHTVVRLGRNAGRLALFVDPDAWALVRGRHFVYTDPDVVPDDQCPLDAIERFGQLLQRFRCGKVGFGLRIDDLPPHYPHRDAVVKWEGQFWQTPIRAGVYHANIDTTFALYPPTTSECGLDGLRTGPPYVARHETWYLDPAALPEDEAFYRDRLAAHTEESPYTSHWSAPILPDHLALREP